MCPIGRKEEYHCQRTRDMEEFTCDAFPPFRVLCVSEGGFSPLVKQSS